MTLAYQKMSNRQRKWMIYLIALFVLGWGFTPYQDIFLGLILGTSIGFYSLWLLQRKVNHVGQAAEQNRTARGIGTFSRFAGAILAVMIALRYPEYIHLLSVIIGLMTLYIVIIIDFVATHKEKSTRK